MKAVILEGNAVNPGDLSWEPVQKICDPVIYESTTEAEKIERIGDVEIVAENLRGYLGGHPQNVVS